MCDAGKPECTFPIFFIAKCTDMETDHWKGAEAGIKSISTLWTQPRHLQGQSHVVKLQLGVHDTIPLRPTPSGLWQTLFYA